jgi:hypothetical protein
MLLAWPCAPHPRGPQLRPVRLEIVDDAVQGSRQQHSTHQQHNEDHVGECRREVHDLGGQAAQKGPEAPSPLRLPVELVATQATSPILAGMPRAQKGGQPKAAYPYLIPQSQSPSLKKARGKAGVQGAPQQYQSARGRGETGPLLPQVRALGMAPVEQGRVFTGKGV